MKKININIISITVFIAALVFLYWEAIYGMIMDWYNDENYSHGFLIPFISGYLLLQRKDELETVEMKPSLSGIPVLFIGLGLFLVGHLSSEYFTTRFSMLVVLAGMLLFVFGMKFFKITAFPFFYLLFMIPLPYILYDSVAFPLKLLVSTVSVDFLDMVGILVLREGNIIHLVDVTLEVADACSGIRSIISLMALSTALAYFTQRGWIKRTICISIAIPIAIFVNAIRVILTGVLANKYGATVAEGFFHESAGLVIFGIAIVMLIASAIIINKVGPSAKEQYE